MVFSLSHTGLCSMTSLGLPRETKQGAVLQLCCPSSGGVDEFASYMHSLAGKN